MNAADSTNPTDSPSRSDQPPSSRGRALVTGATGFLGSHLVPKLLEEGWDVTVLTRDDASLSEHPWGNAVQAVEGDAESPDDLDTAMNNVNVAYYLIHSMDGDGDFMAQDRRLAETFRDAAERAKLDRIVYLSGLYPEDEELSPHLASRVEVGEIFLQGNTPTAVLQAAVVLGAGSASFDMLRYLTTRLPVMVTPKWVENDIQPIALPDALHYLVNAATLPHDVNRSFDIGGPDVLTYREMMQNFSDVAGLTPRLIATLPLMTPTLASYWVGLVTPIDAGLAQPLVESLTHEVVCDEDDLTNLVGAPPGGKTGYRSAVEMALQESEPDETWEKLRTVIAGLGILGLGLAALAQRRRRTSG